jgi:hypothetical protein
MLETSNSDCVFQFYTIYSEIDSRLNVSIIRIIIVNLLSNHKQSLYLLYTQQIQQWVPFICAFQLKSSSFLKPKYYPIHVF